MSQTFDPLDLDSRSSVNSTQLAPLPFIEPCLHGKRALELLSSAALKGAVRDSHELLKLDVQRVGEQDLLPKFDECLRSLDSRVQAAARDLAERFGRHLAYVLLTLTLDRSALQTHAYRDYWSTIRIVWLGGGVVSGNLGKIMLDTARRSLEAAGSRVILNMAPHARLLALVGAARSLEPDAAVGLVYDFGGSLAKHAIATHYSGQLTGLRLLPPVATPSLARSLREDEAAVGRALADFLTRLIVRDWQAVRVQGVSPSPRVIACIASYVSDNHPKEYPGAGYPSLRHVGANAGHWLSEVVSREIGTDVDIALLHDGTAAARVFAGQPHTAVLMLGTWLGVGFAPPVDSLTPLSPAFEVEV
jgi:hypothetical protein